MVILAWVITLVVLLTSGGYQNFIRPNFWPLLAGALVVLFLFLVSMFAKSGHTHATNPLSVIAACMVVLLPVIYLPLARGQTLGIYAFDKRYVHGSDFADNSGSAPGPGTSVTASATPAPTASGNDPASAAAIAMQAHSAASNSTANSAQTSATQADSASAAGGKSRVWDDRAVAAASTQEVEIADLNLSAETYLGKHVAVEGMFKNDSRLPKNYYAAYRFMIICCAADAQPSVLILRTDKPLDYVDGSWVRIQGTFVKEKLAGDEFALLHVDSIDPTAQPDRPYMYFTPRTTYDASVAGPSAAPAPAPATDLK